MKNTISNICNSLKKFITLIRENKDVISIIISFCVGVASIIVGCATISISNRQAYIAEEQLVLQEKLEQPIFIIKEDLIDTNDDNRTYYDTEVIKVYNDGAIPKSIKSITTEKILRLEIHRDCKQYELLLHIPAFYRIQSRINSLIGEVFIGFFRGNNAEYYEKLYIKTLERTNINEHYFISSFTLTHIDYIDKFGNSHSLYFNDNNQITEEEFKSTYKLSTQYETQFFMDIDNLSYDELMKIAEVFIKEQNDNK